jgi:hypothetical protein
VLLLGKKDGAAFAQQEAAAAFADPFHQTPNPFHHTPNVYLLVARRVLKMMLRLHI